MTAELRTAEGQLVFSGRGFMRIGEEIARTSDARKKVENFFNTMEEFTMDGDTEFIVWSFINGRRRRSVISTYYGDCRNVIPKLKQDIIFFDPPWGINYKDAPMRTLRLKLSGVTIENLISLYHDSAKYCAIKLPCNYDFMYFYWICYITNMKDCHFNSLIPHKVSFLRFNSIFSDSNYMCFIIRM